MTIGDQNFGDRAIAIIGSGVAGLTTALELCARGRAVAIYADRRGRTPASHVAPALFTPYSGPDEARFRRRTEAALTALTRISREHGDSGVRLGELREYHYASQPRRAWLDDLLHTREIAAPSPCVEATISTRPHIDMLRYIPWLEARARAAGVVFIDRRIASFDELFAIGHRTIINCAGLGARELTGDPLLKPMHGQVVHVPNDIGLTYSLHDDAPGGLVAYIFVFGDRLVLGGTFDPGRDDDRTDPAAIEGIVARCRNLLKMDGHGAWEGLARGRTRELAAARPARGPGGEFEHVRVEREDAGGGRVIVHHYGHGRAGASLSWGTAGEAAGLAIGAAAV